ncbi:uncharacterized protein PODANS_5_6150 [Podospora anserina S mat+]|uniref:Protein SDS23 n=2 Tax=Podospora anserina TaxID=2587412 RepID=SDS23_PODAS|nr:uncharacterized protein PODANS_5_6150 [Podospora anserina S mat+]Q874W3.1 RecName: Full=Protein SDS23 [Podospora anserina]CAD60769.1 unnamed protein product [Podospora anserina]CAP49289.1 unnamed protein product [Podospora anserina S mat+]CDP29593.1 Putative protein similar to inducer of sexual development Sds23/Moc1 [Podospora anserina S mat+]
MDIPGAQESAANSSNSSLGATLSTSQTERNKSGHITAHRQSFAEDQRRPPPSPRSHRHPSLTQQAVQELMNHPPINRHANPQYAGRNWQEIAVGELAVADDVKWTDLDESVQDATLTLLKNHPTNAVLVRETPTSKRAISTFDYSDLNAYLLVVVGLAKPEEEQIELYDHIAKSAQAQTPVALREIQPILKKSELVALPAEATLDAAVEAFGSGIHRLLITNSAGEVIGILSQLRLLEFFWKEAVNFPVIDRLYGSVLRDLQIGSTQIIAVNADGPLADALLLMHNEGLTSVAVVDQGLNVLGNISTADLRLLTSTNNLPLLKRSCMHFISVILNERGVEHGRDSFPVFYVNPYSTLAHTVAKLVATRSHRMWVVETASPSPSAPATPLLQPVQLGVTAATAPPPTSVTGVGSSSSPGPQPTVLVSSQTPSAPQSPLPGQSFPSVPSASLPGAHVSGRLSGVVSLTDVLNLFAKSSGLRPSDPSEQRARRRRSSSASVRPSLDAGRGSVDFRR